MKERTAPEGMGEKERKRETGVTYAKSVKVISDTGLSAPGPLPRQWMMPFRNFTPDLALGRATMLH